MWVRIQEVSFPVEHTDSVVDHIRDTVMSRYNGDDYRGFRLLLDRRNSSALEVSYWASLAAAESAVTLELTETGQAFDVKILRTDHYELAIDAG